MHHGGGAAGFRAGGGAPLVHAPASRPMIGVNRGANFGARRLE